MTPLLAEMANEYVAVIGVAGPMAGAAVVWLAQFFSGRRDKQRADRKADEKTIVDHLSGLTARMEAEVKELQAEARGLRAQLTILTGHVMYLEGLMESKGVPFRRWEDVSAAADGSGPHRPLPASASGSHPKSPDPSPAGGPP